MKKRAVKQIEELRMKFNHEFTFGGDGITLDITNADILWKWLEPKLKQVSVEPEVKPACEKCIKYVKSPVTHRTIMYCKYLEKVVKPNFGCVEFESKSV